MRIRPGFSAEKILPLFLRSLRKTKHLDVKYLVKYAVFTGIGRDKLRKIRNLRCEMNPQIRPHMRKINGLRRFRPTFDVRRSMLDVRCSVFGIRVTLIPEKEFDVSIHVRTCLYLSLSDRFR